MSQSITRNNFTDILLDPTTIAIVGSIAIHGIFGANLAFFTQPSKELKKPDPGTVKVLELTASELQRIPQAPKPVATPIPSQQVLPPVYQPSIPAPPVTQPITPPIVATAPNTIPLTPTPVTPPPKKVAAKSPVIRIPPQQKVVTKPTPAQKDQKATPQPQPQPPTFDPDISFKPTPEPALNPDKPKTGTKPTPTPSSTPPTNRSTATKKKPPKTQREIDGELQDDREPSKPSKPSKPSTSDETGLIIPVPLPGTKTAANPKGSPSPQPGDKPPSEGQIGSFERNNAVAVNAKLQDYIKKYPGIKIYPAPLKPIVKAYPPDVACSKFKQSPFIVLMVPFSKVPENQENDVLGTSSAESFDVSTFGDDNKELSILAKKFGVEAAIEADRNRPPADKGKQVLYQNRVQFDPTTCKK